jgi:hypothetical protein
MVYVNIKVNDFYDSNSRSEINYVVKAMEKLSMIKFTSWRYIESKEGYFGSEIAARFQITTAQKESQIFKEYFDGNISLDNLPRTVRLYIVLNNMEYESSWETFNSQP